MVVLLKRQEAVRGLLGMMAGNPFAPVIPCHRVVCADFTLGGYGGGLKVKRELFEREKRGYQTAQEISVGEGKLRVFPVESVRFEDSKR